MFHNFLKHPNIKTVLIELYLYENYNNILKMFEEMDFIQDKSFLEKTKLMQIDNVKKGIIYKELEPTVLNHLFIFSQICSYGFTFLFYLSANLIRKRPSWRHMWDWGL